MAPGPPLSAWPRGRGEISLFVSSTQLLLGKKDGVLRGSRFHVDRPSFLTSLFTSRFTISSWQPQRLAWMTSLGPHISATGTFSGNPIFATDPGSPPKSLRAGAARDCL